MSQYTNTIESTFASLASKLAAATVSSNIVITDPENIIIDNSSTTGSLGYILKSNIKQGIIFDFTTTNTEKATLTSLTSSFNGCTNLSAFGPFPTNNVTSAVGLFKDCTALLKVDVDALT